MRPEPWLHRLLSTSAVALLVTGLVSVTPPAPAAAAPAAYVPAGCNKDQPAARTGTVPVAQCFAVALATSAGKLSRRAAAAGPLPTALGPAEIQQAYQLPAGGAGRTVAIVDAYGYENAEADLAVWRAHYGLPPCTTANGCFRKVDQRGGTSYPEGDPGWGVEIALDLQAVSAACSSCKILLVEADDASFEAIGTAVNRAVRLGAKVVSNSYGADEFGGIAELGRKYYTHPGVAIVASSGDWGFTTASFPAVLKSTWAIGGTTLTATNRKRTGWTEEAWRGAGSGCSAWITKPAAQVDENCDMRTVADISAVADSADGFAVYDSYGLGADNGWISVGGTSLSAPLIAGMIGLAGNAAAAAHPGYAYAHRSGLKDVIGGSNGYCGDDYLCTGVRGYDGPTGLGSPRGLTSL